ncbi:MAG: hypothetical protein EBX39_06780 [Actinobacteria bacterium]|nr:hypothetical protein [Actinomycetota bacterium]
MNQEDLSPIDPPSLEANNNDLLVWSLYLLGGASKWVDVEDVYIKAFELAPARLSWRTRPEIPDYKKVSKALQSVEAPNHRWSALLEKRSKYERKLSLEGLAWCERYQKELSALYSGESVVTSAANQSDGRRIREVDTSETFKRWVHDPESPLAEHELADIFRCLPGSPKATWIGRFDEVVVAARRNGRPDIERFVDTARRQIL